MSTAVGHVPQSRAGAGCWRLCWRFRAGSSRPGWRGDKAAWGASARWMTLQEGRATAVEKQFGLASVCGPTRRPMTYGVGNRLIGTNLASSAGRRSPLTSSPVPSGGQTCSDMGGVIGFQAPSPTRVWGSVGSLCARRQPRGVRDELLGVPRPRLLKTAYRDGGRDAHVLRFAVVDHFPAPGKRTSSRTPKSLCARLAKGWKRPCVISSGDPGNRPSD